ncbi:MAG: AAA family ATPase [Chitinophagaceae bacterium]|nr:AAA family ATPase [Chitinophagaceae bacterium]
MNKIGFKNFRRFKELKDLEYKGITFLVGRNNSGKSTLVKALILISNYFKSDNIFQFPFGNSVLEDANIVTFGRALCRNAKEREIEFSQSIENYSIVITIGGEPEMTYGFVRTLKITETTGMIEYSFDLLSKTLRIAKLNGIQINLSTTGKPIMELMDRIEEIKNYLATTILKKTSREFIELNSELSDLEEKIELLHEIQDASAPEIHFTVEGEFDLGMSLVDIVRTVISNTKSSHDIEFKKSQEGTEVSEIFDKLRGFKEYNPDRFETTFEHFFNMIRNFSIEYLPASTAKQSALFAIRDKNNALAQAIHETYQLKLTKGEKELLFIEKWMKKFEIGDVFEINMFAGEAYEFKVKSHEVEIHLADKGMGSVQAMLIILRIACIIRGVRNQIYESGNIGSHLIVIEEPELNLHPALQSILAELFLEANQHYGLNFIVETHSEYILRRTQVLVANNEFAKAPNDNPFTVCYFVKEIDQQPYAMTYLEDGTFNRNFGDGFFDEASASTLELIKLRRTNKN